MKKFKNIPFNKFDTIGNELNYLRDAINLGHISGDGIFTKKCNELLEDELQVKKCMLTTSCTHALELSALLLEIDREDEIIVPSFTFSSTANSFVLHGAKPIFIDIRSDTLNMDQDLIEPLITKKTKAIVPVHYGGVGSEMDKICKIAKENNIHVIEDNAHGLFAKYKGKYLGTFGTFSTQSFHETKNFTCGEGGALLINDQSFIERAGNIMDKGTNRQQFLNGLVDKYSWIDYGSSYRPSELLSAFLYAQLEKHKQIQKKRKSIWDKYFSNLFEWAKNNNVALPVVPKHCESSYHLFYLIMPNRKIRDFFINKLKENNIMALFHYIPLHNSKMSVRVGWDKTSCPISISSSERLVRLPIYHSLADEEIEFIINTILNVKF
tara:strand:- start:8449 stop:9591 length:1143 start_codon:yes stop_codon:yes gene_type:complete